LSNFPSKRTLRRLAAQACVAGLQLTLYNSSHKGVKMMQCPDDAGIYCPEVDCRALVGPDWTPVGLSTSDSDDDDDTCVPTYCTLAPPRWGEHADARHANADAAVLRAMQRDFRESNIARSQAGWHNWGSSRPPVLALIWEPEAVYVNPYFMRNLGGKRDWVEQPAQEGMPQPQGEAQRAPEAVVELGGVATQCSLRRLPHAGVTGRRQGRCGGGPLACPRSPRTTCRARRTRASAQVCPRPRTIWGSTIATA
jgi:hypothetical protein